MQPGHVIILNGTSSAGKSTLAKALQSCLAEPYLHLGIDTVIFALPRRYLYPPDWHEVFRYHWPADGSVEGLEIEAGPYGHRLISGLHHAVAALSRTGQHVIVDHVLLERAWADECAALLAELPALFVGVLCPLEVVEQRERERQDRTLGQARAQYHKVHRHGRYDLTVDTSQATAEECAALIQQQVRPMERSAALSELRQHAADQQRL